MCGISGKWNVMWYLFLLLKYFCMFFGYWFVFVSSIWFGYLVLIVVWICFRIVCVFGRFLLLVFLCLIRYGIVLSCSLLMLRLS